MTGSQESEWEVCAENGCCGSAVADGKCLGHLDDGARRETLQRMSAYGRFDARGVRITKAVLTDLLAVVRNGDKSRGPASLRFDRATFESDAVFIGVTFGDSTSFARTIFEGDGWFSDSLFSGDARFTMATFLEGVECHDLTVSGNAHFGKAAFKREPSFHDMTVQGHTSFDRATFEAGVSFLDTRLLGSASFEKATFSHGVSFEATIGSATFDGATMQDSWFKATFIRDVRFHGTQFSGNTMFDETVFSGHVGFLQATFHGDASFDRATFAGEAHFGSVQFKRGADFQKATFERDAWFGGATFMREGGFAEAVFKGDARFIGTVFCRGAEFYDATFASARDFGPVDVRGRLGLQRVTFLAPTTLEIDAEQIWGRRIRFPEGAILRLGRGDALFEEAEFGAPSIIGGKGSELPRIISLSRADVGNLVLADVDLRACRFYGAHNLDGLRLEGTTQFPATPPTAKVWTGRAGSWRGFVSRRQTLAEEQEWRARDPRGRNAAGWYPVECQLPAWLVEDKSLPKPEPLEPDQIAPTYRALRKGREDSRNEPGAADFYYGEMEMRRYAHSTPLTERRILDLYWLVSGYGLRASRALAALLLCVVLSGLALYAWGFRHPQTIIDSLLFSAESTTSLLRAPVQPLTDFGRALQIILRLLGPLFIGLALLSLRGRVKR